MDPVADPIKTSMLPCGVVTGTENLPQLFQGTPEMHFKMDGSMCPCSCFLLRVQRGTTTYFISTSTSV